MNNGTRIEGKKEETDLRSPHVVGRPRLPVIDFAPDDGPDADEDRRAGADKKLFGWISNWLVRAMFMFFV